MILTGTISELVRFYVFYNCAFRVISVLKEFSKKCLVDSHTKLQWCLFVPQLLVDSDTKLQWCVCLYLSFHGKEDIH
jgi:hypothetical protein